MSKTLIHCTSLSQSQSFINFLNLKQNNTVKNLPNGVKIFEDENTKYLLVVSKTGKENILETLGFIYKNYTITKALNIGIAGCSDGSVKIGTLFCTNKLLFGINFGSLTTVDTPLETDENLETLLVDTEAKYFLEASKENCKELYVFKVVSDYLETKDLKNEFIESLIQNVYSKIEKYIN